MLTTGIPTEDFVTLFAILALIAVLVIALPLLLRRKPARDETDFDRAMQRADDIQTRMGDRK